MFFESFLPTDYEVTTSKHIIHRSRVVIEKRLTLNSDFVADLNKPVVKITKVKKTKKVKEIPNNTSKLQMCKFQQFNFKYTNAFLVSLSKEQENKLAKIYSDAYQNFLKTLNKNDSIKKAYELKQLVMVRANPNIINNLEFIKTLAK